MLLGVWIAVVVVALVILGVAAGRLLGRLGGLRRAAARLQRRQAQAMRLQTGALELQETLLQLQEKAEITQARVAAIVPARD